MARRTLEERFNDWDAKNPEFYKLFSRFALSAYGAGHKRISAWLIVNRIRWETAIETKGEPHKVPNDFIALFARKMMAEYPFVGELFATRPMKRATAL